MCRFLRGVYIIKTVSPLINIDTVEGNYDDAYITTNPATFNKPVLKDNKLYYRPNTSMPNKGSYNYEATLDNVRLPSLGSYTGASLKHIRQVVNDDETLDPDKPLNRFIIGDNVFDIQDLYIDLNGQDFTPNTITDTDGTYDLYYDVIRVEDKGETYKISISYPNNESSLFSDQGWSVCPIKTKLYKWDEGVNIYTYRERTLYHRLFNDAGSLTYQVCYNPVNNTDKTLVTIIFNWVIDLDISGNARDIFDTVLSNGTAKAFFIPYKHKQCRLTSDGFFSSGKTIDHRSGFSSFYSGFDPNKEGLLDVDLTGIAGCYGVRGWGEYNLQDDKYVPYPGDKVYDTYAISKSWGGVKYYYFMWDDNYGINGGLVSGNDTPYIDGDIKRTIIETGTPEGHQVLAITERKWNGSIYELYRSATYWIESTYQKGTLSDYLICSNGTLTGTVTLPKRNQTLFDGSAPDFPETTDIVYGVYKDAKLTRSIIPITKSMTSFFSPEHYFYVRKIVSDTPYDIPTYYLHPHRVEVTGITGLNFIDNNALAVKLSHIPHLNGVNAGNRLYRYNFNFPKDFPLLENYEYEDEYLDDIEVYETELKRGTNYKNVNIILSNINAYLTEDTNPGIADYDAIMTLNFDGYLKYEWSIDAFNSLSPITVDNAYMLLEDVEDNIKGYGGNITLAPYIP